IAIRQIRGMDLPRDTEKGFENMRTASMMGSTEAQYFLGNRYESGVGVAREPERARQYYRLCAAKGIARCEFRLGSLLLNGANRTERDVVQGVAWLQLAGEQGFR